MSTLPEPGNSSASEEDLQRMSLLEHLEELRQRIFRSIIAVAVVFVFCWFFVERIAEFLAQPIYKALPEGSRLTFLGVTDPFIIYVKVAALMALFLASPFVLYQVWRFVAPGLYQRERRRAIPFIFFGSLYSLVFSGTYSVALRLLMKVPLWRFPVFRIAAVLGALFVGFVAALVVWLRVLGPLWLRASYGCVRSRRWQSQQSD